MKNNLILSGLHLSLTGAHKEVVSTKMDKIFKHEEKIIRARIELERSSKSSSHENEFVAKGHLGTQRNNHHYFFSLRQHFQINRRSCRKVGPWLKAKIEVEKSETKTILAYRNYPTLHKRRPEIFNLY